MAKNREPEPKPEESSDSDESLTSEPESGSESDSEPETQAQTQPKNPAPKPPKSPPAASGSESLSGSDSGSESESESESGPETQVPEKPKPNLVQSVKQGGDVKGSAVGVGVKRGGGKGVEVEVETPEAKKAKKGEKGEKGEGMGEKSEVKMEDSSKKLFQRVFSEDDEIGLLKGMLEFITKRKMDPVASIDEFVEFVKKSLRLDVTKVQLLNKMKRLRGKYKGNWSRLRERQDLKITKPHERETYELSKKIWGELDGEFSNGDGVVEGKKLNGSAMKKCVKSGVATPKSSGEDAVTVAVLPVKDELKNASADSVGVVSMDSTSTLEQRIMREEIKSVDTTTQRELEKKLKEIEVAELELCARRCEYVAQKARLMIAAKKNEI